MVKYIYIVKSGTLSQVTNQFNLTPYYNSSLKKAIALKNRILSDNQAENITEPFDKEFYGSLVEAIDYVGEGGKYTARIMIEKERVW